MQSRQQNPPKRHHYVPEFLLKAWTGEDGKLARFVPTPRGIAHRRLVPKAVGFEHGLYETTGFPNEHAQQMETLFFGPIDNEAAIACASMVAGGTADLTSRMRKAWALFVMSLWFRSPRDVEALRGRVSGLVDAAARKSLASGRPDEVLTPEMASQLQMEAMRRLIDDEDRGTALLNMSWQVLELTGPGRLLVSDWPIRLPGNAPWIGGPDSFLSMPLAPDRLFLAAGSDALAEEFISYEPSEIAGRQNKATVGQARAFVAATDASPMDFVAENLGTLARPSVFQ